MKKLLIILVLGLTAWAAWGSGWDSPDFTGAGLTTADSVNTKKVYVNTTTGDSIIIYTTADTTRIVLSVNGRQSQIKMGAAGGPIVEDTLNVLRLRFPEITGNWCILENWDANAGHLNLAAANFAVNKGAGGLYAKVLRSFGDDLALQLFGSANLAYKTAFGYVDTTEGVVVDQHGLRTKKAGGVGAIDTIKAGRGLKVGTGDMLTAIYMQNDSLYIDLSTGAKLQMKPVIIPAP